ncbi:hypothetical protein [Azospirillum sp. sgz302134]
MRPLPSSLAAGSPPRPAATEHRGERPAWIDRALAALFRPAARRRSVLHISYMVHIPYYTVQLLRERGYRADYMAVGTSPFWDRCDYVFRADHRVGYRRLKEWWWFWSVVARYETVHLHFMTTHTQLGWELALLKRMGRTVVAHFRGCEARDRERNMRLHPQSNICQDCDYHPPICQRASSALRRDLAADHADAVLVTTPDMLDFLPGATHFPFFAPVDMIVPPRTEPFWPDRPDFRIVHATVHPGIEGTAAIEAAVRRLREKGYPVEFVFLRDVPHDRVMAEYARADLAIGKMKMGYYANGQIEAMCCGVPTVTWVRPEFMTPDLKDSGFIFTTLDDLERVIEHCITHPDDLARKRAIARSSILRLHDNTALADRLIGLYERLAGRSPE